MALSKNEQEELDRLVDVRQRKYKARDRATREAEAANEELKLFLQARGLSSARTTDGRVPTLLSVINWRDLKDADIERDYPRAQYPQIYMPRYMRLKDAVNERMGVRDPKSTVAVSQYVGHAEQLRVFGKATTNSTKRRTR